MAEPSRLTEPQLAVLRVLWARGRAGVPEIFRELWERRRLAQSTVATMVSRLEKRGFLEREFDGRQYLYRPTLGEDEVKRAMVHELTSLLFAGDAGALVSHLVEQRDLAPDDLEQARALLDALGDDEEGAGDAG